MKKQKVRPFLKLGKNLATLRERRGWTQDDLAHKSGVVLGVIKDIERGVKEGRYQTRVDLVATLGCSLADLYDESKGDPSHRKALPPSHEFLQTVIEHPERANLAHATLIFEQLEILRIEKRAFLIAFAFENFEIARAYLPDEVAPGIQKALKAL